MFEWAFVIVIPVRSNMHSAPDVDATLRRKLCSLDWVCRSRLVYVHDLSLTVVDQLDQWSMLMHLHYKLADKLEGYNFKWKIDGVKK